MLIDQGPRSRRRWLEWPNNKIPTDVPTFEVTTRATSNDALRQSPSLAPATLSLGIIKVATITFALSCRISTMSTPTPKWLLFAIASGACAALNGVFAKL